MLNGLLILHVLICILLTIVVLLQFGKGAEVGAVMGSGQSQNIFTSSSRGNFFSKLTTFLAVAFLINTIALSSIKTKDAKTSIFDSEAPKAKALNRDNVKDDDAATPDKAPTPTDTKTETK